MKTLSRVIILPTLLFFNCTLAVCQHDEAGKIKRSFCGFKYKDTAKLHHALDAQLQFLQIKNADTIVDIGSSSGAYDGAYCAIAPFKNVHFVLVDIDSNCLNSTKVNNMINYYGALRGEPLQNSFSLVINRPDSLMLPLHHYSHVWMFNTLHEIDDKKGIARQMAAIMQTGGELIIYELLATAKRTIHQGCKKKLLSRDEIIALFANEGLVYKDQFIYHKFRGDKKNPLYFFRFIRK